MNTGQISKNIFTYFQIIPECFDELFKLLKEDIRSEIKNMTVTSTPELKLTAKMFHIHSFVVLFLYLFPRIWCIKILNACFSSN